MTTQPFRSRSDPNVQTPWQVLAHGAATGGLLTFGEARIPPRSSGPSFHVHSREDESVYVVAGVLTVALGDERLEAGAGDFVWLPREVPHTFANLGTEPCVAVGAIVPGGLDAMFAEQAEYFATLTGLPDPEKIAEIGGRYGVKVVGPPLQVPPG